MPKKTKKKELEEIKELEEAQIKELKKVETEEVKIKTELSDLKKELHIEVTEKFTYKDVARGVVGAIFGMSIMGWHEGVRVAAMQMPWLNVFVIVIITVIAGSSVLYFSQYKRIKEKWIINKLLPRRFIIFYLLSIVLVFFIYWLFNIIPKPEQTTEQIIKLVVVVTLPAMVGASAADIIRL